MSEREMTVEQQRTLGQITAAFGVEASPYVDARGYVVMVDGDNDRWEITPSGARRLMGKR